MRNKIREAKNRIVLEMGKRFVAERFVTLSIGDVQLLCEFTEYMLKFIETFQKDKDITKIKERLREVL